MSESQIQAAETPIEDLRRYAHQHYEEVSSAAHVWHSVIPKAINFYFDHQTTPTPPAPEAGEWSVRDFDYHEYGDITLNETRNGVTVAFAYMQGRGPEVKKRAAQIVSGHTALPRLVEALKLSSHNAADETGPCWCAADDRVFGHSPRCVTIRALALTTLRRGE
jgi:hypothetical protein